MRLISLFLLFFVLVSCGRKDLISSFLSQVNANPQYQFKMVKYSGKYPNSDYVVFQNQIDDKFYAINIYSYEDSGLDGLSFFENHLEDDLVVEIVRNFQKEEVRYRYVFVGDETLYLPYTVLVDYYVGDNNHVYQMSDEKIKDLEMVASDLETMNQHKLALKLVSQYGLSYSRTMEIINIQKHYQLNSRNGLTTREKAIYFKALTGESYDSVKTYFEKFLQGDSKELDEFFTRTANYNQTTPEVVREIIGEFFLQ